MTRRVGGFCILFLRTVALAAPFGEGLSLAQNDEGGVELIVHAGFGGLDVNYSGGWVPFHIQVSNQGAPISGRLVVVSKASQNQGSQDREFIKDIQLPTGSRQFHEIAAYLNSG